MCNFSPDRLQTLLIKAIAEKESAKTLLLSSECLYVTPTKRDFSTFFSLLETMFDSVKIVVYLRRQDKWLESRYKQMIVGGNHLSIDKLKQPMFCDYKPVLDKWASRFGISSIFVRPYERGQFVSGDLVTDFLHTIGVNESQSLVRSRKKQNLSLGAHQCDFRQLANCIGISGRASDALNVLLLKHTQAAELPQPDLLSFSEKVALLERYEPSNRAIAQTYLSSSRNRLFLDEWPEPGKSSTAYRGLSEEATLTIARYIRTQDPNLFGKFGRLAHLASQSPDEQTAKAGDKLAHAFDAAK